MGGQDYTWPWYYVIPRPRIFGGGGSLAVSRVRTSGPDFIVLWKRDEGDYEKQLPEGGTTNS